MNYRETLLLVDDAAESLQILLETFRWDYRILAARNGMDALARARQDPPPDLILLDVAMPEMDGYEVCQRLKADPATTAIPVIFLTAMTDRKDEARGLALGAVDYVRKPIQPELIRARVANHLELKRVRDNLDRLVQEKAAEIARINAHLQMANQAKADFLAVISHELRTPLNAVIGFSDMLLADAGEGAESRPYLEIIREGGQRLLDRVNEIIQFVKLDPDHFPLEVAPLDLKALLEEVGQEHAGAIADKGLAWRVVIGDGACAPLAGDSRRLKTVLGHLVGNAVKFTDSGGVTVTVEADPNALGAGLLQFEVADDGPGVDPDFQARIFDFFTQQDGPMTRRHPGMGLGLATCRKLVEMMGGAISLESAPGTGSRFRFTVRLGAV